MMEDPRHPRPVGAGVMLHRLWLRLCCAGLPPAVRERRRLELESDVWERRAERRADGAGRLTTTVAEIAGLLRGTVDDARWRRDTARGHPPGSHEGGEPGSSEPRGAAFRSVAADVRFALRSLRRDPLFASVAVLCLALGIGANTAIFSLVNGVLLQSLPYPDAHELVRIEELDIERGRGAAASYPNFLDWRQQAASFDELAASAGSGYLMLGADEPRHVNAGAVTPNLFTLLGVQPTIGRTLLAGDDDPIVVLSDELWRAAFGARSEAVGSTVTLDGVPFEIVGVVPPASMPSRFTDLWVPIDWVGHEYLERRDIRLVGVYGRLRDDVDIDTAAADLALIRDRLREAHPESNEGYDVQIVALHESTVDRVRATLWMLLGAVGLLLLIACINVANLLLARVTSRSREVAVRAALGAGRWRLARQLLTEASVLSIIGSAAGLVVAYWSIHAIRAMSPGDIPRLDEVGIDATVLGFTLVVSLATAWLFGIAPAWQASRTGVAAALQHGGRAAGHGAAGTRFRSALVVAEVALALVLLLGAGLLANSFRYLWAFDPGFDPDGVLVVDVANLGTADPEEAAFAEQLYERLRSLPGVDAVGGAGRLPGLDSDVYYNVIAESNDVDGGGAEEPLRVSYRPYTGDYLQAMAIPFVAGAPPSAGEDNTVVINNALARALWGHVDAVGLRLRVHRRDGTINPWLRVAGVVGDVRYSALSPEPRPEMYARSDVRIGGGNFGRTWVVLHTEGDPLALATAAREAVHALDPNRPVASVSTAARMIADRMARPRFYMALFSMFGALALALSAAGIFGVASYTVTQRVHEIGVRIALGAHRSDVLRLIVGRGALLAGIGIAIGLAAGRALSRYVESLLYGVTPTDAATFAGVTALLAAVALLAFWLPARRAATIDPIAALRRE